MTSSVKDEAESNETEIAPEDDGFEPEDGEDDGDDGDEGEDEDFDPTTEDVRTNDPVKGIFG